MLLLRLALRNLLRHPVKSILIGSLIVVGTALLFITNSVFESTSEGLEKSFIGSLTGDFAISAKTEENFGLFGSEIPIVSEYESIPAIADFTAISEVLNAESRVLRWTPIVSAAALVNIGGYSIKAPVFGVDAQNYFDLCSDIIIEEGDIAALSTGGVFLNAAFAAAAEAALGRKLVLGESITFSMYSGGSFRLRRGSFAGVHRYPAPTEVLDRVVLADPTIVRALCNYTLGFASKNETAIDIPPATENLDDLFADPSDIKTEADTALTLSSVESNLADTSLRDKLVMTDAAAWSFALARVAPESSSLIVQRAVASALKERQSEARVMDWRGAAGSSALLLFAVRMAFNIGVGFLILGAVLVIMNALVISVLERTGEIGSMRALGATRSFIRSLFILETMILTLASALVGVLIGVLATLALKKHGLPLDNPLLISLFGGNILRPVITLSSIGVHLVGAALIGSLAWIYPVSIALKIQPVSAMAERD